MFCNLTYADTLDKFISSLNEQETLVSWVKVNAPANLTKDNIAFILSEVYSNAYSQNIDPHLILAMVKNESGFRRSVKTKDGSIGLMQVIPRWHKDKLKGRDPTDVKVSIEVGTKILFDCASKHKNNISKALNCYSGGGGKVYANKVYKFKKEIDKFVNNKYINTKTNVVQI